jgi:hypothetical protein
MSVTSPKRQSAPASTHPNLSVSRIDTSILEVSRTDTPKTQRSAHRHTPNSAFRLSDPIDTPKPQRFAAT